MAHVREELALGVIGRFSLVAGAAQLLLLLPTVRDVGAGADELRDLPLEIVDGPAAIRPENEGAVLARDAILLVESPPAAAGFLVGGHDPLAILGMQAGLPGSHVPSVAALLIAKRLVDLAEPVHNTGVGMHHVEHVAGVEGDLRVELLGLPERLLGLAALDDFALKLLRPLAHPLVEGIVRRLQGHVALLDLREHPVHAVDELSQFVLAVLHGAGGIILLHRHRARGFEQLQNGTRQHALQLGGQQERDEARCHKHHERNPRVLVKARVQRI